MRILYGCWLLLLVSCSSEKTKRKDVVLAFVQAKKYRYVTRMVGVPAAVMNKLAALEKYHIDICDSTTKRDINLTDFSSSEGECFTLLHFALIADTACLLAYRQGGIGACDVIYYIKYKGNHLHAKYIPSDRLVLDTMQLTAFLKARPNPENDSSIELTHPPPWPTKSLN